MPYRSVLLFLTLLGIAVLQVGCAAPREATGELPSTYPNHTFSDIREALGRGTDTLRSFQARASLSVTTPERSGSFSARIRARRGAQGDSLYLRLSKFSIEGARLLVTPDSFFVYDAIQNELTYGALADAGAVLPSPLRTGRAFENLLGIVRPAAAPGWAVRPSTEEEGADRYVLTRGGSGRDQMLVVDPSRWRALRYTERSADGTLLETRSFSDFGRFSGVFVPRRVELRQPTTNSAASVSYRDLTLNPASLPPFELDVPASAERVLVAR